MEVVESQTNRRKPISVVPSTLNHVTKRLSSRLLAKSGSFPLKSKRKLLSTDWQYFQMGSQLEALFGSSSLELVVPDGSLDLPEALSSSSWLDQLASCSTRDLAFFDERLQFILTVRIPALSAFSDPSIAAPIPSPTMITFLSHLQVSLEASYISPVMSAVPPSTPTMMSPTRSKPTPTPLRSNLAPRPAPLHPPNTPNPIPSTSTPDLQYARTEGGAVINSYIWGEGREKDAVNAVGPAFSLLWSHTQNLWIALYKLDIAVVWMQTRFTDPLLCLTASVTLRDKPLAATPQREPLMKLIQTHSVTLPQLEPSDSDMGDNAGVPDDDEDTMNGFEEINLLSGLSQGVTFGIESKDAVSLKTTRLGESFRKQAFSLRATGSPLKNAEASKSRLSLRTPIPTLRKSYRKILAVVSGIKVRMRTTFVPYMLMPGSEAELEEERRDAGNEERTVVLSVEVENGGESGMGFMVERVQVSIGGEGARADLIGWGESDQPDAVSTGELAEKKVFPIKLFSVDQYNLLYVVSFLQPFTDMASTAQRALSIVIIGRPISSEREPNSDTLEPVQAFSSRWSSFLDLSMASQNEVQERPVMALSDRDAMPIPASPFPLASPTTPVESISSVFSKASTPVGPVAGSKRHTIAGLASSKASDKINRKFMTANYRASTGAILRSSSGTPRPSTPPPPVPSLVLPANSPSKFVPSPLSMLSGSVAGPPGGRRSVSPAPSSEYFNSSNTISLGTPGNESPIGQFPLSPTSMGPIASPYSGMGSAMESRRQKMPMSALPPLPNAGSGGLYSVATGMAMPNSDGDTLLVSISLLPPHRKQAEDGSGEDDGSDEEGEGDVGLGKIYPLDIFTLEIFVFNKSTSIRQCEVSYPEKSKHWQSYTAKSVKRDPRGYPIRPDASAPGLIPMENNLHIGPLRPETCQSVRMQFMALKPGIHTIDALRIHDLDSNQSINLRSVMNVVVHDPKGA